MLEFLDARTADLIITWGVLIASSIGAVLVWRDPPFGMGHIAAYGYIAIAAAIGPVAVMRVLGPGGLGWVGGEPQRLVLAAGHTIALIFTLTLLAMTLRRVVLRRGRDGDA